MDFTVLKSPRFFMEGLQVYTDKFINAKAKIFTEELQTYVEALEFINAETVFYEESFLFLVYLRCNTDEIVVQVNPFQNTFEVLTLEVSETFKSIDQVGSYLKSLCVFEEPTGVLDEEQ